MLTAMMVFTANDTVGKWLTSSYSISELVLFCGVVASLTRHWRKGPFDVDRPWLVLRAVLRWWKLLPSTMRHLTFRLQM